MNERVKSFNILFDIGELSLDVITMICKMREEKKEFVLDGNVPGFTLPESIGNICVEYLNLRNCSLIGMLLVNIYIINKLYI